jgi:hypothetical protein
MKKVLDYRTLKGDRMNYIEQLQADALDNGIRDMARQTRVNEFRTYLNSSKFHDDTTVQVSDVHRWLDYITEIDIGV